MEAQEISYELERVSNSKEIPKGKRWYANAVYEIERDRIQRWLEIKAHALLQKNLSLAELIAKWDNELMEAIKSKFYRQNSGEEKYVRDAEKGDLERATPTIGGIIAWLLATCVAASLELVVFYWMYTNEGASAKIFLFAVLLLIGGVFAGYGAGNFFFSHKFRRTMGIIGKAALITGMVLLLAIALIRGGGAWYLEGKLVGILAGFLPLLLGSGIVVSEAILEYSIKAKKFYKEAMFSAQQYMANQKHNNDINNEVWEKFYKGYVKSETPRTPEARGKIVEFGS